MDNPAYSKVDSSENIHGGIYRPEPRDTSLKDPRSPEYSAAGKPFRLVRNSFKWYLNKVLRIKKCNMHINIRNIFVLFRKL